MYTVVSEVSDCHVTHVCTQLNINIQLVKNRFLYCLSTPTLECISTCIASLLYLDENLNQPHMKFEKHV